MTWLKRTAQFILISLLIWLTLNVAISFLLTMANPVDIPHGRTFFFQDVKELLLTTDDGLQIAAWHLPNDSSEHVIILLNGKGGNRKGMIRRAKFYLDKGFAIMMPDLRATGESDGELIAMGWQEQKDLASCYRYLQEFGYTQISAHGLSLGAATIAYSLDDDQPYEFMVLESCSESLFGQPFGAS
ncbi:MAG: hypothetical protein AAFO94_19370 [Bacteroidota bacterium]